MRHSQSKLTLLRASAQGSLRTSLSPASTSVAAASGQTAANIETEHQHKQQHNVKKSDQPTTWQCALPLPLSSVSISQPFPDTFLMSDLAKPLTQNYNHHDRYGYKSVFNPRNQVFEAASCHLGLTAALTAAAVTRPALLTWRRADRPVGHRSALSPFSPHLIPVPVRGLHGRVHGPGPGLPLEPTGPPHPPLQRPDRLGMEMVGDPINIAADHKDDPRELVHRILWRSGIAPSYMPLPWGPDAGGAAGGHVSSGITGGGGGGGGGGTMGQEPMMDSGPATGGPAAARGVGAGGRYVEGEEVDKGVAEPDLEQLEQLGHLVDGPLVSPATFRPLPSTDAVHALSGPDLAAAALGLLPRLPPGHVAQLAVALARMGHFDMEFKGGLVEHVVGRMYQFTPQQLSDVAWAVASCGYYDLPFLEALAGRLRDTAPQWDARSLAKVLWSFGRFNFVGQEPSVGEEALEAMIQKLQSEQDGSTIAEVVFAAGQLAGGGGGDWQDGRLQELVAEWAERGSMGTFGPEALGKLSAGLVGLGVSGSEAGLVLAIAQRAAELAPRLEAEDICRIMELLSSHGYCDPPALEALATRSAELAASPPPTPAGSSSNPSSTRRLSPLQAGALLADFNALGYVSPAVLGLASHAYAGSVDSGGSLG